MTDILLVDGYNIIGDWPELRELKSRDLEGARDRLIEEMAEYQAFTGMKVMIIFDAHMVPGIGKKYQNHRVNVIYTKENETADERIERIVKELKTIDMQIYVATSDFVEQTVTFGRGALRKSARELKIEMGVIQQGIDKEVRKSKKKEKSRRITISDEMTEIFERWRRGDM
ncbi:MAG: NYN domain-containing protein [Bacillaceae bacterium]|nr:NYN domain-containing protein [Bacillaceae bacterium]